MKGVEVVDRLKAYLPKYTTQFSNLLTVSSLTRSGTTATLVTSTPHGRTTGDYITVYGAEQVIPMTSITRSGTTATAVTSIEHGLVDPSGYLKSMRAGLTVDSSGNTPSGYDGSWQLLSVIDQNNLTFKVTGSPATPATTAGQLQTLDNGHFNRYTQVTVVDTTTLTYTVSDSGATLAAGSIFANVGTNVIWSATFERIHAYFTSGTNRVLGSWCGVVMGAKTIDKDGVSSIDSTTLQNRNGSYFYQSVQTFDVFLLLPCKTEIFGGEASDLARELETAILKSIVNVPFPTQLCESVQQPTTYLGNETVDYYGSYYVHVYSFAAKGYVQEGDTRDVSQGSPLKEININNYGTVDTFKSENKFNQ